MLFCLGGDGCKVLIWYSVLQNWSVSYWLDNGASPEKLVVGLPSYGRSFTLANKKDNGVGAPTNGPGHPGTYSRESGILTYYEVD